MEKPITAIDLDKFTKEEQEKIKNLTSDMNKEIATCIAVVDLIFDLDMLDSAIFNYYQELLEKHIETLKVINTLVIRKERELKKDEETK